MSNIFLLGYFSGKVSVSLHQRGGSSAATSFGVNLHMLLTVLYSFQKANDNDAD